MVLQQKIEWEANRYPSHKQRLWNFPVWLNGNAEVHADMYKTSFTEFLYAILRT